MHICIHRITPILWSTLMIFVLFWQFAIGLSGANDTTPIRLVDLSIIYGKLVIKYIIINGVIPVLMLPTLLPRAHFGSRDLGRPRSG